ncbi:EamA family transporter [Cohnella sp. JJ-181]|uniref:EamA family transporter n=1 Tax=Cohnella rhizoplanae TaxID=2974897 RepID=UPI0022FF9779|nr:EamA family transporter [Cohnella sp. JJ-181]CAI6042025.1 hypothetical protein COHCIP112018_01125 [Cohnella sp. JJ-181]
MHWFPLAVFSALAFGLAGFFMKTSQMRGGALSSLLLGLYAAGTAGFWLQALMTGAWQPFDGRLWLAGAVIGLGSAWGNLLFMRALAHGPASLVSPLANANILIVMGAGIAWFGEPLRTTALVGAAWLLAGIALLSLRGGSTPGATGRAPSTAGNPEMAGRRWYPLALAAMGLFVLRNGGLKVTDGLGLDSASVLWAGYLLSLLWFAADAWIKRSGARSGAGRDNAPGSDMGIGPDNAAGGRSLSHSASIRTGFRWGLAAGVFSYGGLQLYSDALARGPSHLVAPIFAANSLVVVVLSLVLYRERLSIPQWAALFCLLAGLILIRI